MLPQYLYRQHQRLDRLLRDEAGAGRRGAPHTVMDSQGSHVDTSWTVKVPTLTRWEAKEREAGPCHPRGAYTLYTVQGRHCPAVASMALTSSDDSTRSRSAVEDRGPIAARCVCVCAPGMCVCVRSFAGDGGDAHPPVDLCTSSRRLRVWFMRASMLSRHVSEEAEPLSVPW